ncbi:phosphoseryl-tRNA kinase [Cyclospora cayetanensis]|uniref:Phosphoseryl-tRNA kinase n=1 Tax=Cyclospora cayetanensis TaxID=88456 RepID=A0A1D3D6F7_9EIME|nr:phosphoseryl-tRNA kinase [Cyclospora cayetanensis]
MEPSEASAQPSLQLPPLLLAVARSGKSSLARQLASAASLEALRSTRCLCRDSREKLTPKDCPEEAATAATSATERRRKLHEDLAPARGFCRSIRPPQRLEDAVKAPCRNSSGGSRCTGAMREGFQEAACCLSPSPAGYSTRLSGGLEVCWLEVDALEEKLPIAAGESHDHPEQQPPSLSGGDAIFAPFSAARWKAARHAAPHVVEEMLRGHAAHSRERLPFACCCGGCRDSNPRGGSASASAGSPCASCCLPLLLLVVDDTHHLKSLRKPFFQIARTWGCGFLQVWVSSPVSSCVSRRLHVPPAVVHANDRALQTDPGVRDLAAACALHAKNNDKNNKSKKDAEAVLGGPPAIRGWRSVQPLWKITGTTEESVSLFSAACCMGILALWAPPPPPEDSQLQPTAKGGEGASCVADGGGEKKAFEPLASSVAAADLRLREVVHSVLSVSGRRLPPGKQLCLEASSRVLSVQPFKFGALVEVSRGRAAC